MLWAVVFARALIGVRRTIVVSPGEAKGSVVAFMPARNEETVIEASVRGVLAQPIAKLVVIDDASTDGTAGKLALLSDPRLEVIAGSGPREGECGKPAALANAYERARPQSEWLLFVDADVVLAEGALGGLLAVANGRDLITVIPRVTLHGFAEHAVMPSVGSIVLAEYPPDEVADPKSEKAFANGQVILIRRATYEAAGGHRAVIAEVLEDVRLARRVKARGGRLLVVDGRNIATTRMYESWRELAEGWIKNLYLLLGRSTVKWVLLTIFLGWIGPIVAVACWPYGAIAYGAIFVMQASLRAIGGASFIGALLAPLGALGAAYLALVSRRRHLAGRGVEWKGRRYR